ncbi:hypothetical protein HO133_005634 [Letharia lupina]|uniref:Fungal STAND N-terminal Goodbye domain-containing protein n=1 Tax=Letharia lupina TaxID=560253 RepID=A0A8H6C7N5_9LECA|nr:uncharacterized protein HO133_005634 [Letharia lupina]KAF6218288.1 hypothetical protein HO133_005634 [Letharia lupina]
MENDTSTNPAGVTPPRLYGIVGAYIQKQLPRDIHPAYKALRDHGEVVTISPQLRSTEETTLPSLAEQDQGIRIDQVSGNKDDVNDEDGLPLEELYKDAASEKRLFKAAIEAYEKTTKDSKYMTNIISDATHTWEDVLAEVNAASERYNDVSGFWGKIRKGLRSFGANNQVFDAWTGLLPTQSQYLSILCGGLKLIFSAAARLQDLRNGICEALAEIPILLASTHRALGVFKKSKKLHQCSAALYSATISALRHIVDWYKEKAIKKFSKSILKQSSYEQQSNDLIKAIRIHAQNFDDCARLCAYETIVHTNQTVGSHYKDSRKNYLDIAGQLDRFKIDSSRQNNLLGNIVVTEAGNTQQMMGVMASRFNEVSATMMKEMKETIMKETLVNFLSSSNMMDSRTQDERRRFRQQLLTGLEYEDSVLEQDVQGKLQTIWTASRQEQDRVVAIMRSHKLHKWITSTDSSILLINANHKGSARQESTSFICAKLVDSITPSPTNAQPESRMTLPLAFFCGEHLRKDDPNSGPDGMMRSLLAQLLLAYRDFDLRTVQRMQNLNYDDVNELCDVFDLLIAQLPRYVVVFCVVDAISFYEDNPTVCEEATTVVQALVDVVERTKEDGCAFKLLLMSPWNSRVFYKKMLDQEGDVVWMPAKVPAQGGFTAMKWSASVDTNLAATDSRLESE